MGNRFEIGTKPGENYIFEIIIQLSKVSQTLSGNFTAKNGNTVVCVIFFHTEHVFEYIGA